MYLKGRYVKKDTGQFIHDAFYPPYHTVKHHLNIPEMTYL